MYNPYSEFPRKINAEPPSKISPALSKYANTINSSILGIHLVAEDLLDVKNMYKLKSLTDDQLQKIDGTLRNVINALYDVKALLN